MPSIQNIQNNYTLPTSSGISTFIKENCKPLAGAIFAAGLLYTTGILRPLTVALMGPTAYGALKLAFRATGYLLMAVPYAILRITLSQLSYLQILTLSVCAAGATWKAVADKVSGLLPTQRDGAED